MSVRCSSMALVGFVPYKGDWLEVEYPIHPDTLNIVAYSAKPMNSKHAEEVICLHVALEL